MDVKSIIMSNGVEMAEMAQKDKENYKQEWFKRFVPADKQQIAIDSYCFDKDGCSGYLWHVFSYRILECVEGDEAINAFDRVCKKDAVLLANWGDTASCRLKNLTCITAELIGLIDDVILTDSDFRWTYAKTHELSCGPYFYCP